MNIKQLYHEQMKTEHHGKAVGVVVAKVIEYLDSIGPTDEDGLNVSRMDDDDLYWIIAAGAARLHAKGVSATYIRTLLQDEANNVAHSFLSKEKLKQNELAAPMGI